MKNRRKIKQRILTDTEFYICPDTGYTKAGYAVHPYSYSFIKNIRALKY